MIEAAGLEPRIDAPDEDSWYAPKSEFGLGVIAQSPDGGDEVREGVTVTVQAE